VENMAIDIINGNRPPDMNSSLFVKKRLPSDGSEIVSNFKSGDVAEGKVIVNEAIEKLRSAGDIFNKRLDFRVDEKTHRVVVKVIDTKTDKVIKEIPPEQLLHLAAKIQEMIGLLVDEER
jgi:uncharacterized FlaG/YvyC family protein